MYLKLNKEVIMDDAIRGINRMIGGYNKSLKPGQKKLPFINAKTLSDRILSDGANDYLKEVSRMAFDEDYDINKYAAIGRNKSNEKVFSYLLKLEYFVYQCYKRIIQYTPIEEGDLRKAIKVRKDGNRFLITLDKSDCEYGIIQHEVLTYQHDYPTRAKFMQDGVLEVSEEYNNPYNINIEITSSRITVRINSNLNNLVKSSFENRRETHNYKVEDDPLDFVLFDKLWREED